MAITLIGNVGNDTDTTTEITLTHGVTINENDQILFFISCDGDLSNQTATPPSTATIYSANTMSGSVEITRDTAGASEPSSYQWTYTAGERKAAGMLIYRGVDTTTPVESDNGPNTGIGNGANAVTFTSLTPGEDNCAVITYVSAQEGNNSNPSFSNWPATITERFDNS